MASGMDSKRTQTPKHSSKNAKPYLTLSVALMTRSLGSAVKDHRSRSSHLQRTPAPPSKLLDGHKVALGLCNTGSAGPKPQAPTKNLTGLSQVLMLRAEDDH